jgi:arylsulfatase A
VCVAAGPRDVVADDRPNIVLIMADDLGYECLGANGGEYKTPNLDKLARQGMRFTNCFAKGQMADEGTRVPLIANWPDRIKAGVVSDELVDFADMLPTLCEAASAPIPANYPGDGKSLLPTLLGASGRDKRWVYVWYQDQVFARTRKYKLIGKQDGSQRRLLQYSGLYQHRKLDADQLTNQQKAVYAELRDVIDRLAGTRHE